MSPSKRQTPPRSAKLHLKLRSGVAKADREAVFSAAREAGATGVRPLFPDSTDEELLSLHTLDVDDEKLMPGLIKTLETLKSVEFVEPEVKRTLKSR